MLETLYLLPKTLQRIQLNKTEKSREKTKNQGKVTMAKDFKVSVYV